MFRKIMMVLAATLVVAVFVLPAAAQFGWGCGLGGFSPFGFGGFGVCPFGTGVTSAFTATSSFTSTVSGIGGSAFGWGVPFGFGGLGCGLGCGLGGFGFSPFGFC